MDVTPLIPLGAQIIQSYGADGVKVSGVVYKNGVMVTPKISKNWNAPDSFDNLDIHHFECLFDEINDIDVVLVGAGANGAFLKPPLRTALKNKGISVDVMATGAACRTYNVLMAEGRRIAAFLMPV